MADLNKARDAFEVIVSLSPGLPQRRGEVKPLPIASTASERESLEESTDEGPSLAAVQAPPSRGSSASRSSRPSSTALRPWRPPKAPLPPAAPTLGNLAAMAAFAAKKDQGADRGVNACISTVSTTSQSSRQSESSSHRGTRSSRGSETWNLVWNRPAQMRLPRLPKQAIVAKCLEDAMKPDKAHCPMLKDRAKDPPRDTKASRCALPQIAPGRSLSASALGGGRPSSDRGRRSGRRPEKALQTSRSSGSLC